MELRIPLVKVVEAPDDATHYTGDLLDDCVCLFYKVLVIGVVGDHWFYWSTVRKEWVMSNHREPLGLKPIPEEYRS